MWDELVAAFGQVEQRKIFDPLSPISLQQLAGEFRVKKKVGDSNRPFLDEENKPDYLD